MNIVGQQAFAAAAALRANSPVAGCRDARQIEGGYALKRLSDAGQARQLAGQIQAVEFFGLSGGQLFIGVGRRQPREVAGPDFLRQYQCVEFFLQVDRGREVQQAKNQGRVFGFPVLRFVARLGEVGRELVAVAEQIRVDAAGIDFKELFEPGRRAFIQLVSGFFQVNAAHQAVAVQRIGAVQLGQAALGQQAQAHHLADPVTGMDIAQGEQRIMETAAFDQRDALAVASHRDVLRQAF